MSIEARAITKTFGPFTALKAVNVTIPDGQLVALLGPSGSGKTSLLRIIAGLEFPDEGTILFNGEDATRVRARDRRVGFVFQHYALFRHLTVFENVAFGLRVKPRPTRPPPSEIAARVMELLKLVQLDWLADRHPSQLSGGQRQRVALARALAVQPQVLLLDEPFGALDAKVRKELRRWLRRLHDEIRLTSVFVTHDVEEALEVADQVVVMNEGRVEQVGTPDDVYERPVSAFVYQFLGHVNLFHARVHRGRGHVGGLEVELPDQAEADNQPAIAYVRPHDIDLSREQFRRDMLPAVVTHIVPVGSVVRVELRRLDDGQTIDVEMGKERFRELALRVDESVFIRPRHIKVFPVHPHDSPTRCEHRGAVRRGGPSPTPDSPTTEKEDRGRA